MQGDIANACGSINRLAVLQAVRKHIPFLALAREHAEQRDVLPDSLQQDGRCDGTNKTEKDL